MQISAIFCIYYSVVTPCFSADIVTDIPVHYTQMISLEEVFFFLDFFIRQTIHM